MMDSQSLDERFAVKTFLYKEQGDHAVERQDWEAAVKAYLRAVMLSPDQVGTMAKLAWTLLLCRRFDGARLWADRAAVLDSHEAIDAALIGHVYLLLGEEGSQAYFEKASHLILERLELRRILCYLSPLLGLGIRTEEVKAAARWFKRVAWADELKVKGFDHELKGEWREAVDLYLESLSFEEKSGRPRLEEVGDCCQHAGRCLNQEGQLVEAETMFRKALEVRERHHGAVHLATATTLTSLALLFQSRGEYGPAEPLLQRAASIIEQICGATHRLTAESRSRVDVLRSLMKSGSG